ncbi:hypothetical protein EDC01DRAFT_635722 [Geopyxis carbonaria]|nr:hypothetical protein EDC01DRAFT_635722 [Geopyxis carbonaria]
MLDKLGWRATFAEGIGILSSPNNIHLRCSLNQGIYILDDIFTKNVSSSLISTRSISRAKNVPLTPPLVSDRAVKSALRKASIDSDNAKVIHKHQTLKNKWNQIIHSLDEDEQVSFPEDDETLLKDAVKDAARATRRSKIAVTAYQWHQRMGHANTETLRKALQDETIPTDIPCDVCIQAKMQQRFKRRPPKPRRSTKPFERIHCDLLHQQKIKYRSAVAPCNRAAQYAQLRSAALSRSD